MEADACGGPFTVLTRLQLEAAERELGMALELMSARTDSEGNHLHPSRLAALVARRDEMRRRRDGLKEPRDLALEQMRDASASGDVELLEAALLAGREALLEGDGDEDGIGPSGRYMVTQMRSSYLALSRAKICSLELEADRKRRSEMARVRVQTLPLGFDRFGRRYWHFEQLDQAGRGSFDQEGASGSCDSEGEDNRDPLWGSTALWHEVLHHPPPVPVPSVRSRLPVPSICLCRAVRPSVRPQLHIWMRTIAIPLLLPTTELPCRRAASLVFLPRRSFPLEPPAATTAVGRA